MMYQSGLVAVIKVNGKVLRENKDEVLLPFGAEYSILIKNLKSRRVQVKVSVDGTDATESCRLVIDPNSEIELERFIRNGNMYQGNRFKFIERTGAIEDHRGIGAEDGLIRIEYWTEADAPKFVPPVVIPRPYLSYGDNPRYDHDVRIWNSALKGSVDSPRYRSFDSIDSNDSLRSKSRGICGSSSMASYSANNVSFTSSLGPTGPTGPEGPRGIEISAKNDAGITVGGSVSNQTFSTIGAFAVDAQSEVLVLKLRGNVGQRKVERPILVSTKLTCSTCGKKSASNVQYCPQCGTNLRQV